MPVYSLMASRVYRRCASQRRASRLHHEFCKPCGQHFSGQVDHHAQPNSLSCRRFGIHARCDDLLHSAPFSSSWKPKAPCAIFSRSSRAAVEERFNTSLKGGVRTDSLKRPNAPHAGSAGLAKGMPSRMARNGLLRSATTNLAGRKSPRCDRARPDLVGYQFSVNMVYGELGPLRLERLPLSATPSALR